MKCLTWNLEWASPGSRRATAIMVHVAAIEPDVACYTEVVRDLIPDGHLIEGAEDYGYAIKEGRRKVILRSKHPWEAMDTVGDENLPPGRFVSGITGGVRFVGVCIPWRDAHVSTGRKDRKPWEDHLAYLASLTGILRRYAEDSVPVCLIGDYNQRIPRLSQPVAVAEAMSAAIPGSFMIATAGMRDREGLALVDHIACSPGLTATIQEITPKVSADGLRLSDHPGIVATLSATTNRSGRAAPCG